MPKKLEVLVPGMFVPLPTAHNSGSGASAASEEISNAHEVEVELDRLVLDSQRPQNEVDFKATSSIKNSFGSQSNSKFRRRGRQRASRDGRTQWVKRTQEGSQ